MGKYKLVKQNNLKDCGACSLASIIEYYGGYVPLEKLREMTKTSKEGTTAYHIVEASKKLGFDSYGMKLELEDIDMDKITLPVIAYTIINNSYRHFLVIYEIDFVNKKVTIADPASKIKKLSFLEFKKIFKNVIIILVPMKKIIKYKKTNIFTNNLVQILKKNKKSFIFIILITLIFIFTNFLNLIILKKIIDFKKTKILFIILIIILFLKQIIGYYKNKKIIKLNKKLDYELTNEVFSHIIKLPYRFYKDRTTGEVISKLNDLDKIKEFSSNVFISMIINLLFIIPIIFLFLKINSTLFLIVILLTIIYAIFNIIFKNKINNSLENLKNSYDYINNYKYEIINSFEMIKGLNLENHFSGLFIEKYKVFLNDFSKYESVCNIENIFKNLILDSFNIIIIFFGITLINNKMLNISSLLIFIVLLSYYIEQLNSLFNNSNIIKETHLSLNRINDLYYVENNNFSTEKLSNINIKNLSYQKDEINPLFKNINLSINNNSKILLFGESGCGKSTLLKLIKKYYQNDSVLINNKIIKNNNVVYVSQNEFLFTDTIYNNITLNRNIDNEEFNKILKICRIDEIIKNKSLGYNTLLEENGFNISGGEKQRIILARTLLSKFDLLLLDESLSEVDSELEREILIDLFKFYNDKIIILVSHRLNNIDLFDLKYELKNKQIERRN